MVTAGARLSHSLSAPSDPAWSRIVPDDVFVPLEIALLVQLATSTPYRNLPVEVELYQSFYVSLEIGNRS
jgi:hypothetical protein